ncbi:MAG: hypothetical protein KGS72_08230 [Cyanobacteria bacterium REEB67]|nr:hypothetical protein [Cyanobacteria bacterium REEB67]
MSDSMIDQDQLPKPHAAKRFVLACLALSALPLFYLLFDLLSFRNDVSSWLAMRLVGASLLLDEQKLYVDFWDWSQPVVYDLLQGLLWLRSALEKVGIIVFADNLAHIAVWLLVVLSLCLTAALTYQVLLRCDERERSVASQDAAAALLPSQIQDASLALLFSTALASLILRFDFGDLPHLLVLALAPWIFLRWLVYRGLFCQNPLALAIGSLAGLSAALDLPFLGVFITVEVVLAADAVLGGQPLAALGKRLWRPEMLGFFIVLLLCLLRLTLLEPVVSNAYWHWTMPLRWLNYQVYDPALYSSESSPDRRDILYGLALASALTFFLQRKNSFFLPPFVLAWSGFLIYMVERQGLSRDLSLTVFGTTLIASLTFLLLGRTLRGLFLSKGEKQSLAVVRLGQAVIVFVAAAVVALTAYSLGCDRDRLYVFRVGRGQGYEDLLSVYDKNTVWQKPVLVLCDYPAAAYPALLSLSAERRGYLLWARPLRLLVWLKAHAVLVPPLKDFYDYMLGRLRADIGSGDANLIVVQSALGDALERSGLAVELEDKYVRGEPCRYVSRNEQPREYFGTNDFERYLRRLTP